MWIRLVLSLCLTNFALFSRFLNINYISFKFSTSMNSSLVLLIALILIILSFVLLGIFAYLIFKPKDNKWKDTVKTRLGDIQHNPRMNLEHKIIHLDKLLEYTLQNYFGMHRQSLGSILRKKSSRFSNTELDNLWFAHKVRNQIAHDVAYQGNAISLENSVNIFIRYCKKYSL